MHWDDLRIEFTTEKRELVAYSTDASLIERLPLAVFWPKNKEEVIRIVEYCYENGISITPRGAGTGLVGGAVPSGGIVLDLSKMNRFEIDAYSRKVVAEPGVVLNELNLALGRYGLFFPIIPSSERVCTIGGMISTNAAGLRALRYGWTRDWVEELEIVTGEGDLIVLKGEEAKTFCGTEGILGIVVGSVLRVTDVIEDKSLSIFRFSDLKDLVQSARKFKEGGATFVEYLDNITSSELGFGDSPVLIVGFEDDSGELKDRREISDIIRKREEAYPVFASRGFYIAEDPMIPFESQVEFLKWLEMKSIPTIGHIGVGIFHPMFSPSQEDVINEMYDLVVKLGGRISGEHGIGVKKAKYLPDGDKERLAELKRKYDPKNILNPGKVVNTFPYNMRSNPSGCVQCGLCKTCPVYLATRDEGLGARTRAIMCDSDSGDVELFYMCTLCRLCDVSCPVGVELPDKILDMRIKLIADGKETPENRKMIEKVRKYGNPFGKIEGEIKEWYCC